MPTTSENTTRPRNSETISAKVAVAAEEEPLSTTNNAAIRNKLLVRSKARIDAGERSMRDGVEDFAIAIEEHGATQREVAWFHGKSEAWVSGMLRWRRAGYPATAFGPESKAARERRRKALQATEGNARSAKASKPDVGVKRSKEEGGREPHRDAGDRQEQHEHGGHRDRQHGDGGRQGQHKHGEHHESQQENAGATNASTKVLVEFKAMVDKWKKMNVEDQAEADRYYVAQTRRN